MTRPGNPAIIDFPSHPDCVLPPSRYSAPFNLKRVVAATRVIEIAAHKLTIELRRVIETVLCQDVNL